MKASALGSKNRDDDEEMVEHEIYWNESAEIEGISKSFLSPSAFEFRFLISDIIFILRGICSAVINAVKCKFMFHLLPQCGCFSARAGKIRVSKTARTKAAKNSELDDSLSEDTLRPQIHQKVWKCRK